MLPSCSQMHENTTTRSTDRCQDEWVGWVGSARFGEGHPAPSFIQEDTMPNGAPTDKIHLPGRDKKVYRPLGDVRLPAAYAGRMLCPSPAKPLKTTHLP